MKRICLAAFLLATALIAQSAAEKLFEQALLKERSQGDLRGAIALFQKVATAKDTPRPLAARALLEMARCQEKQGGELARRTYEKLLKDFADQPETVAAARARIGALAAAAPAGPRVRQVWDGEDVWSNGDVSPDGRLLSYSSGSLALVDVAARSSRVLAHASAPVPGRVSRADESRFSPDGRQLAFGWFERTNGRDTWEVRLVNADGSGPRTLVPPSAEPVSPLGWSPDGRFVAVAEYADNRTSRLHLVAVATGEKREILKGGKWRINGGRTFSPDGQWIAVTLDGENRDIYVVPTAGGDPVPVVTHPALDRDPFWTADGKSIVFLSDRSGAFAVWRVPMNGGRPAGEPVLVRRELANAEKALTLSKSGTIYYSVNVGGANIYSVPFDFAAGKIAGSPQVFSSRSPGGNLQPHLSTDGKRMVWTKFDAVSNRGPDVITLHDMTTGEEKAFPAKGVALPTLAPGTGNILVDSSVENGSARQLSWLDPATGKSTPLLTLPNVRTHVFANFSHDGRTLFYLARNFRTRSVSLVARDLVSGAERTVATGRDLQGITLSPDDRTIYTERRETLTRREVIAIPVAGGEPRVVATCDSEDFLNGRPILSPDGKSIYTVRRDPARQPRRSELIRIDVATGKVDSTGLLMKGMVFPQLDPARGRIYLQSGLREIEIWAAENLLK